MSLGTLKIGPSQTRYPGMAEETLRAPVHIHLEREVLPRAIHRARGWGKLANLRIAGSHTDPASLCADVAEEDLSLP